MKLLLFRKFIPYLRALLLICKKSYELLAEVNLFEFLAAKEISCYPSLKGIIIPAQALKTGVIPFRFFLLSLLLKLNDLSFIQHFHSQFHLLISSDQNEVALLYLVCRYMIEGFHKITSVTLIITYAFLGLLQVKKFEFTENFVIAFGQVDESKLPNEGLSIYT